MLHKHTVGERLVMGCVCHNDCITQKKLRGHDSEQIQLSYLWFSFASDKRRKGSRIAASHKQMQCTIIIQEENISI
jgi:hypothetical protein